MNEARTRGDGDGGGGDRYRDGGDLGDGGDRQAAELARAFDEAFARPPRVGSEDSENLLGFRIDGHDYAVRLRDVRGLLPVPKIVPVPSPVSELLGIAGLRGNIVPIYNLGALLGHPPTGDRPAWLILVGAEIRLGLAIEHLTGYLRVRRAAISSERGERDDHGARSGHSTSSVRETVRIGDTLREIVNVESVVGIIKGRAG